MIFAWKKIIIFPDFLEGARAPALISYTYVDESVLFLVAFLPNIMEEVAGTDTDVLLS